jgi:Glycosyl hydrolases family 16
VPLAGYRAATLARRSVPDLPGFTLVLDEQFRGSTLNGDLWDPEHSNYGADGNRIQYYRPENIVVADGVCTLYSKEEAYLGHTHTAGMFSTRDLGVFYPRFGRYEIRAKIPHGHGLWPAFWLRHRDGSSVCEVDIMESFHGQIPGRTSGVLHRTNNSGTFQNNVSNANAFFEAPTYTPGWHTWAVDILDEDPHVRFVWRLDGVPFRNYLDTSAVEWSTRHPGEPLFDVTVQGCQIGGNFVGHPDDPLGYSRWLNSGAGGCLIGGTPPNSCTTTFNGHPVIRAGAAGSSASFGAGIPMVVDYIRVYEQTGDSGGGSTLLQAEGFEGLSDGATVTAGNTAFDEVVMTNATALVSTVSPIDGSRSIRITHGGASGNRRLAWTSASLGGAAYRQVAKVALSALSGDDEFCMVQASTTRLALAMVMSNGAVRCYPTSSSFIASPAGLVQPGAPIRLEMFYNAATGQVELRIWESADDPGAADVTLTPSPNGATANPSRVGPTWFSSGASGFWIVDGVELHDAYWS